MKHRPCWRLAAAGLAVSGTMLASAEGASPGGSAAEARTTAAEAHATAEPAASKAASAALPLAGKTIVIDPGHQLGNARHPDETNRLVNAGGFYKACNTAGTATNAGFPEATFAWRTALALRSILRERGARVVLTRYTNSYDDWGPCIDVRGRTGNRVGADVVVSLHGNGAGPSERGFFVIRPALRAGWTDDIFRRSQRLAAEVKAGLVARRAIVANSYGGDGFDVRGDLGTLNWSNVPIVLVELGNMRNSGDAQRMTSRAYRRAVYARGLAIGLQRFALR
jgi:N-acetylmuramoyl-L-alanine amidase